MDTSFSELLKRAELLGVVCLSSTQVNRTLTEVLRDTEKMHARLKQDQNFKTDEEGKKMLLLGGVDIEKLTEKIEKLAFRETKDPETDTDVAGLLEKMRQDIIVNMLDETTSTIYKTQENRKWKSIYAEWDARKECIFNSLSDVETQPTKHAKLQPCFQLFTTVPNPKCINTLYSETILKYNQCPQLKRPNLVDQFTQLTEAQFYDVHKMWNVLKVMIQATPPLSNNDPVKPRQLAPQFVQSARGYLELSYRQQMCSDISRVRTADQLDGITTLYKKIKSLVRMNFRVPDSMRGLLNIHNSLPLWPHVYYSLRCGDPSAAAEFLHEWGNISPELSDLIQHKQLIKPMVYQEDCMQKWDIIMLEQKLTAEYSGKLRNCSDPYKKAVYAFVLSFDLEAPHPKVLRSVDDFLWMNLSTSRSMKQLSVDQIKSLIRKQCDKKCLIEYESVEVKFQMLILMGHFESAIELLSRTATNRSHAVHMAIALNELSILNTPSDALQPLLSSKPEDMTPMCRLNVVRLIITYAKGFEQTRTKDAMNYYYLLRDVKDTDGDSLMLNCLTDLVMENNNTKMLQLIFGTLNPYDPWLYSGSGIFGQLPVVNFDQNDLAAKVAYELAERCKFEHAIEMYLIAGQQDKALALLCTLLSQVVQQPTGEKGVRTWLVKFAELLCPHLSKRCRSVQPELLETYKLLVKFLQFFDKYHAGDILMASEILIVTHLIPENCEKVDDCLCNIKALRSDVIQVLPDVILAAMDIIYQEYVKIMSSCCQVYQKRCSLIYLEQRCKAIINIAATMQHRMPPDGNKRLTQMLTQMQFNL